MPRAGLTRDRVIEHAAAVADEVGVDNLTLAAVAQRCGVSLPGLYKHIEGLGAVKRDIALIAVRELTATLAAAAVGVAGRDAEGTGHRLPVVREISSRPLQRDTSRAAGGGQRVRGRGSGGGLGDRVRAQGIPARRP